jgi:hypothetical protein
VILSGLSGPARPPRQTVRGSGLHLRRQPPG